MTKTKTLTIDLVTLIGSFPLRENEAYYLYTHRHDGYDFGLVGSSTDAEEMTRLLTKHLEDPTVFGVWVTRESGDGSVDVDILKIMEGSV